MKTNSFFSSICHNSRSISYALAIGLGIGLATKNLAIGCALGLAFALAFTARRNPPAGSDAPTSKT